MPSADSTPAVGDEHGVLKVSAVTWRKFDSSENKRLRAGDRVGPDDVVPCDGDLLISRANTTVLVGAVVVVRGDWPTLMLSDKLIKLIPASDEVDRELLKHALRTRAVRTRYERDATGTSHSMRKLSQGKILSAPITVAPVGEGKVILRLLASAERSIDEASGVARAQHRRLDAMERSALAKAFRGELVP